MKIKGEKTKYLQKFLSMPEYLMIEPTNECNLRCHTCSRETLKDFGSMNFNSFKYILDQFPKLETVKFHGLGEPLLASEAFGMLGYLNSRECNTVIVSNCQWKNIDVERLMNFVEHLYVSVSSANKEGYENSHRGGRWERLIKNIKEAIKYKASKTDVVINFICTRRNFREIVDIIIFAAKFSVPGVRFQIMQNWITDEIHYKYSEIKNLEIEKLEDLIVEFRKAMDKAKELGVGIEIVGNEKFDYDQCIWPFRRVYITWKGEVVPCCMRPDPKYSMGNILETSFQEIWNSKEYEMLRISLKEKNPTEMCKNCPYKVLAPTIKVIRNSL